MYLGTSSSWSFGRRVLAMAHERVLKATLPRENLLYEGQVYDLEWPDEYRRPIPIDRKKSLPSLDFAIYLINAVKFHCAQIFHLFDEDDFMAHFKLFHESQDGSSQVPQVWYIHYLLVLALGKALVVRFSKGKEPPGSDLFLVAMEYLPNVVFLCNNHAEVMELLCCASLYLHSLDFRGRAWFLVSV